MVRHILFDFGGNVLRHGPVDQIRVKERSLGSGEAPAKECPECHALIPAAYAPCPECGHEFPPPEKQTHDAKASTAAVLSGQVTVATFTVHTVTVSVHTKRGAGDDAPKSLRVDYKVGWHRWKSEWVCLEHDGFARQKAVAWWTKRSREPVPATAAEAVEIANAGGLAPNMARSPRAVLPSRSSRQTTTLLILPALASATQAMMVTLCIATDWGMMEWPERFRRFGKLAGPTFIGLGVGPRYFHEGLIAGRPTYNLGGIGEVPGAINVQPPGASLPLEPYVITPSHQLPFPPGSGNVIVNNAPISPQAGGLTGPYGPLGPPYMPGQIASIASGGGRIANHAGC